MVLRVGTALESRCGSQRCQPKAQRLVLGSRIPLLNLRREVWTQKGIAVHQILDGGRQRALQPLATYLALQSVVLGNVDSPLDAAAITFGQRAQARCGCTGRTHEAVCLAKGILVEPDPAPSAFATAGHILIFSFWARCAGDGRTQVLISSNPAVRTDVCGSVVI